MKRSYIKYIMETPEIIFDLVCYINDSQSRELDTYLRACPANLTQFTMESLLRKSYRICTNAGCSMVISEYMKRKHMDTIARETLRMACIAASIWRANVTDIIPKYRATRKERSCAAREQSRASDLQLPDNIAPVFDDIVTYSYDREIYRKVLNHDARGLVHMSRESGFYQVLVQAIIMTRLHCAQESITNDREEMATVGFESFIAQLRDEFLRAGQESALDQIDCAIQTLAQDYESLAIALN